MLFRSGTVFYLSNLSCIEHSTAADYVDRSLFTYERAFVGAFNYTSGANRLDFDHVENRPFSSLCTVKSRMYAHVIAWN